MFVLTLKQITIGFI